MPFWLLRALQANGRDIHRGKTPTTEINTVKTVPTENKQTKQQQQKPQYQLEEQWLSYTKKKYPVTDSYSSYFISN